MEQSVKDIIKTIKLIYTGVIIGPVVLLVIAVYFIQTFGSFLNDSSLNQVLIIFSFVITSGAIFWGFYRFKKQMINIENKNINGKIETYRSAMIIRAASLEGSCFLFIVFYFLSGQVIILTAAVIILSVLLAYFPANYRLSKELKIDLRDF